MKHTLSSLFINGIASMCTPTGRALSHTVLGAISAKFVISNGASNPPRRKLKANKINFINRKRKASAQTKKPASKVADTGHYTRFLKNPWMK
jgi:hypothetical protein